MTRIDFKLPDIGEGVAEGEIISWKVAVGDSLVEDQVMVEVMTDKATVEIGSPVTGSVVEIPVAEGDTVDVGAVIIVLADEVPDGEATAAPSAAPVSAPASAPAGTSKNTAGGGGMEEVDFALPDIGEGVAEGEITKWLVTEGDTVTEDQPMVEVMTDKATVEIGSPVDGTVLKLLHDEGTTVPVGDVLLVLGASDGAPPIPSHGGGQSAAPAAAAPPVAAAAPAVPAASGSVAVAAAPAARATTLVDTGLPNRSDGSRRVRAAPAVRRLAREMNLDVAQLNGTGPHGRVSMDDVRRAGQGVPPNRPATAAPSRTAPAAPTRPAAAPLSVPVARVAAPAPVPMQGDERVPLRGLRKRIATAMHVAKHTAAHFAYIEEIDVTNLVAARKAAKGVAEAKGVKLTYMPYIIKATCTALREFPILNSSLDEAAQEVVYHGDINMGIAVETPDGLIVPVIRQADTKTMLAVSTEMYELADRARSRKTQPADVGGGTFTITNAGNIGGLLATPIINVPEVAIMGVHAIRRRPWVVNDEIVIRDIMYLSLSLDHRVVDGAVGARFMNRVQEQLENPALMLLES